MDPETIWNLIFYIINNNNNECSIWRFIPTIIPTYQPNPNLDHLAIPKRRCSKGSAKRIIIRGLRPGCDSATCPWIHEYLDRSRFKYNNGEVEWNHFSRSTRTCWGCKRNYRRVVIYRVHTWETVVTVPCFPQKYDELTWDYGIELLVVTGYGLTVAIRVYLWSLQSACSSPRRHQWSHI